MLRWNISISTTQTIPISPILHLDCSPISTTTIIYVLTIYTESPKNTVFLEKTFSSLNFYLFIENMSLELCPTTVGWSCTSAQTGKW